MRARPAVYRSNVPLFQLECDICGQSNRYGSIGDLSAALGCDGTPGPWTARQAPRSAMANRWSRHNQLAGNFQSSSVALAEVVHERLPKVTVPVLQVLPVTWTLPLPSRARSPP